MVFTSLYFTFTIPVTFPDKNIYEGIGEFLKLDGWNFLILIDSRKGLKHQVKIDL